MYIQIKQESALLQDLPSYATPSASGMDLRACLDKPLCVETSQWVLVPAGISVAIPEGYELQIRPRSGLAAKHGLTLLNSPGTIDADYRGEIKVIVINLGPEPYVIEPFARIAQMVLARVEKVEWQAVSVLPESQRGGGGFGSTGRA